MAGSVWLEVYGWSQQPWKCGKCGKFVDVISSDCMSEGSNAAGTFFLGRLCR